MFMRRSSLPAATRTRTGMRMEDSVGAMRATSETVKHVYGDGGDGNMGQSQGVGIPWNCSRLHERYGMPGLMVRPDISTAAPSFVTMSLTMETTESGVGSRGSRGEGGLDWEGLDLRGKIEWENGQVSCVKKKLNLNVMVWFSFPLCFFFK